MKKCKHLLCLVLSLVMALSLCTVALADTASPGTVSNLTEVVIPVKDYLYGESTHNHPAVGTVQWKTDSSSELSSQSAFAVTSVLLDSATATTGTSDSSLQANKSYYLSVSLTRDQGWNMLFVRPGTEPGNPSSGTVFKFTVNGSTTATEIPVSNITLGNGNANDPLTVATVLIPLPALERDLYTEEIHFTKVVQQGGSATPPVTTFNFERVTSGVAVTPIDPTNNNNNQSYDYSDVQVSIDPITTNGAGEYEGTIKVTGPRAVVEEFLMQGFFIREVAGSADNWTYDDQLWYVKNENWRTDGGYEYAFVKVDDTDYSCNHRENGTPNHFDTLTFTNTYTANTRHVYTAPTEKIEAPKTFDAGIAVYGVMAVSSLLGMGYVGKKKF